MLSHMNNATSRNIDLIEDRISRLKSICNDAEKSISLLQNELNGIKKSKAFENAVYSAEQSSPSQKPSSPIKLAGENTAGAFQSKTVVPVEQYIHEQTRFDNHESFNQAGQMESSVELELSKDSSESLGQISQQTQSLSDSENTSNSGTPVFYDAKESIIPKTDYKKRVMQLHEMGYTVEEIAHDVGRSTQEIKFTIEIS